jgi:hypothetical protein
MIAFAILTRALSASASATFQSPGVTFRGWSARPRRRSFRTGSAHAIGPLRTRQRGPWIRRRARLDTAWWRLLTAGFRRERKSAWPTANRTRRPEFRGSSTTASVAGDFCIGPTASNESASTEARVWRRAGPAISFGISPALLSSRDFWCGVEYEPGGSATKHQATKPRSDASMTPSTPAIRSSLEDDRRARRAGRTDPQTIAD